MNKKLKITQFTDPMCIWCYGLEPALRKLQYLEPEKVEFKNILGLLVSDVKNIIGDDEYSDARYQQLKNQMIHHFIDAAGRSGIPVSTKHMETRKKEDVTSLPMSIAFESMKLIDEKEANKYMRCMREAAHSYDIMTSDMDELIKLARKFNVDHDEFVENIKNGKGADELQKDVENSHSRGIHSFPTMLIEYDGKSKYLNGYMDYETLKYEIDNITDGEIEFKEKEFSLNNVIDFVSYYNKVCAKEIQVAFNLSDLELDNIVDELEKQECLKKMFEEQVILLKKNHCSAVIVRQVFAVFKRVFLMK